MRQEREEDWEEVTDSSGRKIWGKSLAGALWRE